MTNCIRYKKPFLKDVIFRIDYPSPLPQLHQSLPQSLHKAALEKFPMFEPQQSHSQEIRFEGPDVQTRSSQLIQWVFHGQEREKTLTIDANSLVITTKNYKGFKDFQSDIDNVLTELFSCYSQLIVSRMGLRFINVLSSKKGDPLDWSEYVDQRMLGTIGFQGDKKCTIRAFNILEFNFEGELVKFQFGIANPDYPAIVRKKEFVIDIDSSHQGALEETDIRKCLEISHNRIGEFFENSITQTTRELMVPESL